jgi:hypothetical protein
MSEHQHPTYVDEEIVNVETHHEKSDVDVKALLWFVVIFVVFAAVTHVSLWILFKFYVRLERRQAAAPLTAMTRPADMNVPAEPRLQPFPSKMPDGNVLPPNAMTPVPDMMRMREEQDRALNSYGWVDPQKGVVHIPIEEAKKKVLAQLSGARVPSPALPAPGAAEGSRAPQSTPTAGARP